MRFRTKRRGKPRRRRVSGYKKQKRKNRRFNSYRNSRGGIRV